MKVYPVSIRRYLREALGFTIEHREACSTIYAPNSKRAVGTVDSSGLRIEYMMNKGYSEYVEPPKIRPPHLPELQSHHFVNLDLALGNSQETVCGYPDDYLYELEKKVSSWNDCQFLAGVLCLLVIDYTRIS